MGFIKPVTGVNITTKVAMEWPIWARCAGTPKRGAIAAMFGDNFESLATAGRVAEPVHRHVRHRLQRAGHPDGDRHCRQRPAPAALGLPAQQPGLLHHPAVRLHQDRRLLVCRGDGDQGLGNEKRTIFWQSRDLVHWEKTNPYVALEHRDEHGSFIGHPGNVMLTFDQIDEYVYIFGTGGLARDRADLDVALPGHPVPPGALGAVGTWTSVSWGWGVPNERSPILPGTYGELCFRYIQGNCVLSFFDVDRYCLQRAHRGQAHRLLARRQPGGLRARPGTTRSSTAATSPRTPSSTSPTG